MPSGMPAIRPEIAQLRRRSPHLDVENRPMLAVGDAKGRITTYKLNMDTVRTEKTGVDDRTNWKKRRV